jgi:hypothetical protein
MGKNSKHHINDSHWNINEGDIVHDEPDYLIEDYNYFKKGFFCETEEIR